MQDKSRLIEHAFPLEQASLDSIHEKSIRHGHISTLHIWPARRPLAACRAALIATLLPDPGTPEERKKLVERIGGVVKEKIQKKKMPNGSTVERVIRYTEGGILHWGTEKTNAKTIEWFRSEIRKAHGGRAPRVLDPFAGGGAIPLEAMRLGCETTAVDINPVAWFILSCTVAYPRAFAGKKKHLPEFVVKDPEFVAAFLDANGYKGNNLQSALKQLGLATDNHQHLEGLQPEAPPLSASLEWHVRAWGTWVLGEARKELAKYYPTYADFQPLKQAGRKIPMGESQIVKIKEDGTNDAAPMNAELAKKKDYLEDPNNPRWVAKPTVAYLWARTVKCKNCRAIVPLLKTLWLCKKGSKRILLDIVKHQDATGVDFKVQTGAPIKGGNPAQRREHDKRIGAGTMSRSGARCPCCQSIMTKEDIRLEGQAGRIGKVNTAVVVDGPLGKEYRLPTDVEAQMSEHARQAVNAIYRDIPFGIPTEPTPKAGVGASRAFSVDGYGMDNWSKLFTDRQLLALGTFLIKTREAQKKLPEHGYSNEEQEAIAAYLACMFDRLANQSSALSRWNQGGEKIEGTFARFALPILWDFAECNPLAETSGGYPSAFTWVSLVAGHLEEATSKSPKPEVLINSAIALEPTRADCIITDPPYYDAIPYSDLMDYYYVWLRRLTNGFSDRVDDAFKNPLSPKWDEKKKDGELIDDASRHGGNRIQSKQAYEDGMARAFQACRESLVPEGRLVVVFANKQPDAWETLVSALIRAGFVVDGSWPIQTEMSTRMRATSSAALASSVWLVCRKRNLETRPGWDNRVIDEMKEAIASQLREFWDAGIRGPDFVWAATGPAMEAYSKYPAVKKANEPGTTLTVSEFLRHVRRIVVDFVVGRVISPAAKPGDTSGLDDVTTYYLLHRHDFGTSDAPAGPCILYAVSCNLSDSTLADQYDILARAGGKEDEENDEEEREGDEDTSVEIEEGSGSKLRLKVWSQRMNPMMGYDPSVDSARARSDAMQMKFLEEEKEPPRRRQIPLIDQAHRLMHLWKAGDLAKVDAYLEVRALVRHKTFLKLLQALIELAQQGSDERSMLEKISNHIAARGGTDQYVFDTGKSDESE